MPLRPLLDAALGALLTALAATWRVERRGAPGAGPVILALWHGELLPLILTHRGRGYAAMVSHSADGDRLAARLSRWGFTLVRGSTSRGGAQAARAGIVALRDRGVLAIAVDGPRGPAGALKPGAAALALMAPARLVAARVELSMAFRLPSWDRATIPLPFSRVIVHYNVVDVNPNDLSGTEAALLRALGPAGLRPPSAPSP